jgi:hypothetical protein
MKLFRNQALIHNLSSRLPKASLLEKTYSTVLERQSNRFLQRMHVVCKKQDHHLLEFLYYIAEGFFFFAADGIKSNGDFTI